MPGAPIVRTAEQWVAWAKELPPPTDTEVTVLADGRRLDTPEKVRAWCDEFAAERSDNKS